MKKLSVIAIVLALMVGFAGLARSQEIIGELILPCGHQVYVTFNQQEEYGLIIPEHQEQYKLSVAEEGEKFKVLVGDGNVFESTPPYKQWTLTEVDGTVTVLIEGSVGEAMCNIIYQHYMKIEKPDSLQTRG